VLLLSACGGGSDTVQRIAVPPGATVRAVADSLAAHHLIASTTWFRFRARTARIDRSLKAGIYEFQPGASVTAILRALKTGDALHFRVTLPEGSTLFDLARNAESELGIPRDSLLAAAADSSLRTRYQVDAPSVEGWLLPETFDFNGFTTAVELLDRFLAARQASWKPEWDVGARRAGLSRKDLLTLASIVEGEAKVPTDRPLIAAVYRNRLRKGMPLQADPTIEYAYLLRDGQRKPRLYNKDYALESPWNTYRHPGLPPGPIGNPTTESIEAVLDPPNVAFLYFVAGPDGKHIFSRTYAEHLAAIRRVR
jgi:UPF0755 protein